MLEYGLATKDDIEELIQLRIAYMIDDFGSVSEVEKDGMEKQLPGYFERTSLNHEKYRSLKLKKIKKLYTRYICSNSYQFFENELPKLESDLKEDLK